MTDSPAPQTPPAVRLARFAVPDSEWRAMPNQDYAEQIKDGAVVTYWHFSINNLNDLALAERKLIVAGLGAEYNYRLSRALRQGITDKEYIGRGWELSEVELSALICATAEARARAVLAVLDAHPHLENPDAR